MNWISVLVKGTPEGSLGLFLPREETRSRQVRRGPSPEPDHAGTLISALRPPELWEINVTVYKPPSLGYFVTAA